MEDFFKQTFLSNAIENWILALGVTIIAILFFLTIHRWLLTKVSAYARSTASPIDDVLAQALSGTKNLFLIIFACFLGTQFLQFSGKVEHILSAIAIIAFLLQAAFWLNRGIAAWLSYHLEEKKRKDASGVATLALLGFTVRLAVWAVIGLMILDNLGFNITTLVASLGIGGVAVALAVQNILGDIFASLSIALDKPFVIGDFIIVDDVMGTVEYIGLKTTRLRSLFGEEIVFSNTDLLKSRVRNYKRMFERRIVFTFGVVYQTPQEKLLSIPTTVRKIIETQNKTRFDRAHFRDYGESGLNFEVVYYVLDPDYNLYMDIQQAINLQIFNFFTKEKIEFAYPTRTLYLYRKNEEKESVTERNS